MNPKKNPIISMILSGAVISAITVSAFAAEGKWKKRDVNWRLSSDQKIKAVYYRDKSVFDEPQIAPLALSVPAPAAVTLPEPPDNTIDSPPIDGFVPWVVFNITNRMEEDNLAASRHHSPVGSYTATNPVTDFSIGLFDTGAGATIISYENALLQNIADDPTYLTPNTMTVGGVTGTTDLAVSWPLGLFMQGFNAIEPNQPTLSVDNSRLMGLSNYSIGVGLGEPGVADNPTAIGCPVAVGFTTYFDNENPISIERGDQVYSGPDVHVYSNYDTEAPDLAYTIPLELRPTGTTEVCYFYDIDWLMEELRYRPSIASTLGSMGVPIQSLLFVSSVDLTHNGHTAIERTKFMLDTGAQVSVIGSGVASRLALDPANPDFQVDIEGASGETTVMPGFIIDKLEIPVLGQWFTATNVPVVYLDVNSPEGGFLDGIIGMNLFTQFNIKLFGGFSFTPGIAPDSPCMEIERFYITGDIAPYYRDGVVNLLDYATLVQAWNTTETDANWNPRCDINTDGTVNMADLAVLCENWLKGI